ncbi:TOBE domain-containing protein [Rhodoferax sp.]|uniref:TOBE domain-containing protein n=1 Tax=Rhodoferax sp. TaxID=50421 RepID=UPI00260A0903|nr:TOBE domain-containing protein [Rhodoferax sp.]MDD4942036.1 LysR family transcriptional regulator [Rhodoferax sp.]MDD5478542.1 LysR family transcriptional regulator [Rhodoferax sp.]
MNTDNSTTLTAALTDSASDRRLEVLRLVGQSGSISEAARQVGISYKAAWQAIDTLTNLSGVALVDRTVGGSGGGGARITAQGLALLALADELARARQQVLSRFAGGAALAGGLGLRTSMRNQLPCTVLRCEALAPHDPMATVTLQTPGGALLQSSITWESADLLGLAPGLAVLVLCKATAVQVLAVTAEVKAEVTAGVAAAESANTMTARADESEAAAQALAGDCQLVGRVARVTPGQGRDEVVLALDGGGHWVGFATHPFAAALGQSAVARMGTSSLVVGLAG